MTNRSDLKTPSSPFNVVLIISDQHKRTATGHAGNPIVKTPNLDALADDGVTFTRAYSASPLCAPSRAALITATHPYHNTAAYHTYDINGTMTPSGFHRFPGYRDDLTTMGDYFKQRGYRTGAIGKMHVHGETREHHMGFDVNKLRFYTYNFEDYENAIGEGEPVLARRRRLQYTSRDLEGFPYGYAWTGQYNNWDRERCPAVIETMDGSVLSEEHMMDVLVTGESLKFIEENRDQRFLLHVGLEKPHPPWTEIERFMSMYDADDIPDEALPHAWQEGYRPFLMDWLQGSPDKQAVKISLAAYYANVTSMDEKVGQIIRKLKDEGVYENTLIIYTSDHGEMCYEHAQVEKHCMYEAAINVPLIISCPALLPRGETRDHPVSLIDLLPTIGDLCGFERAASFQGESLKPLLLNADHHNPDKVVYAEFGQPGYSQHPEGPNRRIPLRMVRNHDYKYIYSYHLPDQLYPVDSGEIYPADDCCATHPDLLKQLKRCALAGWHNDGAVSRHSTDRDIEDLLGDNHLAVDVRNEADRVQLSWRCPSRVWNWNPQTGQMEQTSVTRFAVFQNRTADIYTARETASLKYAEQQEFAIDRNAHSEDTFYWIIAESDAATLAASRTVQIDPQ